MESHHWRVHWSISIIRRVWWWYCCCWDQVWILLEPEGHESELCQLETLDGARTFSSRRPWRLEFIVRPTRVSYSTCATLEVAGLPSRAAVAARTVVYDRVICPPFELRDWWLRYGPQACCGLRDSVWTTEDRCCMLCMVCYKHEPYATQLSTTSIIARASMPWSAVGPASPGCRPCLEDLALASRGLWCVAYGRHAPHRWVRQWYAIVAGWCVVTDGVMAA